jgi:hypothetical protein
VLTGLQDYKVLQVRLVLMVKKEMMAQLARMAQLAHKVKMVYVAIRVVMETMVQLVIQEHQVKMV